MAYLDTQTRAEADEKARAAGAVTYGDAHEPSRINRYTGRLIGGAVMFVHYFNKAGHEVAIWTVPLQSFSVFETPRVWGIPKPILKELL